MPYIQLIQLKFEHNDLFSTSYKISHGNADESWEEVSLITIRCQRTITNRDSHNQFPEVKLSAPVNEIPRIMFQHKVYDEADASSRYTVYKTIFKEGTFGIY